MSVLFKSPSSSVSGIGGSSTGFPPGDVSNIGVIGSNGKILIKWTDPEDTIIDSITIAKWKGTILIRNKDHYPNNIKDGDILVDNTIKNKYKDTWYEDNNLDAGTTYYYRFFTYSEDKIYNDSNNMIFKENPKKVDPVLKNNSWKDIINVADLGQAQNYWKVGDEIDITLSGSINETVTLQIWDFNHFDKSDGTGKANICFGMKKILKNKQYFGSKKADQIGWTYSTLKDYTNNDIYNSIPQIIKSRIKEVDIYQAEFNKLFKCTDYVYIPGSTEISDFVNKHSSTPDTELESYNDAQKRFPIFTDDKSRIKRLNDGLDYGEEWWTRSYSYGCLSSIILTVNPYGEVYLTGGDSPTYHPEQMSVCFCFNI